MAPRKLVVVLVVTAMAAVGCATGTSTQTSRVAAMPTPAPTFGTCTQPYPDRRSTDICADNKGTVLLHGMAVTAESLTRRGSLAADGAPELCVDVALTNNSSGTRDFNQVDFRLQTPGGEVKGFDLSHQAPLGSGALVAGGMKSGTMCSADAPQAVGQYVVIYQPTQPNPAPQTPQPPQPNSDRGVWLFNLLQAPATSQAPPVAGPGPTTPPESLPSLDQRPQLCESGTGALGCSYRFRVSGPDLVRAFDGDPVSARLALVGPGRAKDVNGRPCLLVRVRVTALTGSVSVNPGEFTLTGYESGRDFATTVPVPGLPDQVRRSVLVAAGTDFVGTLAFPDQGQGRVSWLLSNGQAAASWDVIG